VARLYWTGCWIRTPPTGGSYCAILSTRRPTSSRPSAREWQPRAEVRGCWRCSLRVLRYRVSATEGILKCARGGILEPSVRLHSNLHPPPPPVDFDEADLVRACIETQLTQQSRIARTVLPLLRLANDARGSMLRLAQKPPNILVSDQ